MKFELSEKQDAQATKWIRNHKCKKKDNYCRISYVFTPIGIGDVIIVKCICGKEINITEDNF